ncbi:MAG: type III pantothenate kinase [Bacteroidales bacterium]|nr:type III pantothenate kinase [Bacteroidales bacterium]
MNLVFDIGNTSTKIALFDGEEKLTSIRTKVFSYEKLNEMFCPYLEKVNRAILSTVREIPEFVIDLATHGIPFVHILSHKTKLPFKNEYQTPETLGSDRIAAVAGAYHLFPGRNILVIDAGSAITFDYLSGKSYKGGNISPGLSMRFKALHRFTGKLTLGATLIKYSSPGKNTIDAITAGVTDGLIFEINEYIRIFQEKYMDSLVIITGGDSGYLKDRINYKINYQPDLVLSGLNYILEYNAKKA